MKFRLNKRVGAGLIVLAVCLVSGVQAKELRSVAIVGDSTVCDYPTDSRLRGWGQLLPEFLPWVVVLNEAQGGRSTKTFPRARWEKILSASPEYVLIQFGHNDSHDKSKPESTDAATDFQDHLRRFVAEARAAGIAPVLVTPPHRRTFREGSPTRELEPYAMAILGVAKETGVPAIDLYAETGHLFAGLGEKGSAAFTANRPPDAPPGTPEDRTHFTEYGARKLAEFVASQLQILNDGDQVKQSSKQTPAAKPGQVEAAVSQTR